MFPFTHFQTYQMYCADHGRIHHPYQKLHLRHRPPILIHPHQFHLLPSFFMIRVLVETGKQDSTFPLVELPPLVGIYHWMGQVLAVYLVPAQMRQKCSIISIH